MNPSAVNIAVVDGKTITQTQELRSAKQGEPVRIKAVRGGSYILAEGDKGVAPQNITIKRVGKDLHVSLEGTDLDQPQLIIEDFYGSDSQLMGMAEDGSYHEYVASDADLDHEAAFLIDGDSSAQVLGSDQVLGYGNGLTYGSGLMAAGMNFLPALLGLGGLALAGAAYAIGKNKDDGGHDDVVAPGRPATPVIGGVHDSVGSVQGPIENGGLTDDTQPTFSGTGTPGNTVIIRDNGKVIGEVVVGESGQWEFTPTTPLPEGDHSIVVVEKDAGGNESAPSAEFDLIVDITAPGKSVISGVTDDVGDIQGPVLNGGFTDDNRPTLTGMGEAGARIVVYDNQEEIGETTVSPDGSWVFTPEIALADGLHSFTTVAVDAAGNAGLPSDPHSIIVDTIAPDKGVIGDVIDDAGLVIEPGDSTKDQDPTFGGVGLEPGDTVIIKDNGEIIGTAPVQEDGSWTWTPDTELAEGDHSVIIVIRDPAGNESDPSDPVEFIVDITPPVMPGGGVIGPGGAFEGAWDDQGPITGEIHPGDETDDARPEFKGGGLEPGDTVIIKDNGEIIGTTPVQEDGSWTWTPDTDLAEGDHSVIIVIRDPAGNESDPSESLDFGVDLTAPVMPDGAFGAWDNEGPITGEIHPGDETDDARPEFKGGGLVPGDTVIIKDNGEIIGTAPVQEDGSWTWTPETDLAEGDHSVIIVIRDPAGNDSDPSDSLDFGVDLTAPVMPGGGAIGPGGAFEGAWDDQGPITGEIHPGDETDDARPEFKGGGLEPGDTVIIKDNGEVIGTTPVKEDGSWTWTPDTDLAEGDHSVIIVIRDPAGNESDPSDSLDFGVDLTAPEKPTIEAVFDDQGSQQGNLNPGDITDDSSPTISGKAEPGSTAVIYDNGIEIGRVPVGADGSWSFEPTLPLLNGTHELTVKAVDAAGNPSDPSEGFNFELIAGGAPVAPAINGITDNVGDIRGNVMPNGVTDDSKPTINGTGQAGSTMSIYANGVLLGTVPVGASGVWQFTPDTELSEGLNNITATATNAAGNVSPSTGNYPITVDTTAPGAAVIDELIDNVGPITGAISDGDTTDDSTPTFNGSAEPDSTVIVYDKGVEIGRVPVGADGSWSFTPSPVLDDGAHSLSTEVVDPAGNSSGQSAPISFIVDTSAVAISINYVSDNEGTKQGDLSNGSVTDDTTPTLHGRATASASVNIYLDGVLLGSAPVDASGNWSYTTSPALVDGNYNFTATVVTAATGESSPTADFNLVIDTVAPDKPSIGEVTDAVGDIQGPISNGGHTDDATPRMSGGGLELGDTVHIYDNGRLIGSVPVGAGGEWSFAPNPPLNDGEHEFTIIAEDAVGNRSLESDPYTVVIDTLAPSKPTIEAVFDDQGSQQGNLNPGDTTDDSSPTISGKAEPGSTAVIYDKGIEIGRVPVGADGSWSFEPTLPLLNGAHELTVKAVDAAGNPSDPSEGFNFELIAGGAPVAPAINGITDNVGDIRGNVMPNGVTDDTKPTINGTGQAGSTMSIYANGVLLGTVPVGTSGIWHFTPDTELSEGLNNITATATNAAGNVSPSTGNYPITVDTTAPGAAVIDELIDNVGPITGAISDGDTTDDSTPTFNGSAEPDSTVIVYDKGVEIGRVPVGADGSWSFTPSPVLDDGAHSLSTEVVDPAGNSSGQSAPISFIVDTSAVAISINYVSDNEGTKQGDLSNGSVTDDTTPTLHGVATANASVNIYLDGVLLGSAPVDASGNWSYTTSPALVDGNYNFTATVVTAATGESSPTADFNLVIDTVAPDKPSIGEVTDAVGDIQGPISNGGHTDDATPRMSGGGLELGDTVHIYDNGRFIGSVPVGAGGEWSFAPNPPLNDGDHEFTIIAEDAAGNRSLESDPYAVIIDTVAPVTEAVVTSMSKDSGTDSSDFVTNDGTAGRLIQGTLSAALVVGEKVQVSTDGGSTWLDALLNGDGTWSFVDQSSHSGNWEIQARVVDQAGNSNTTVQSVTLDTSVAVPDAVKWEGSNLEVTFDGSELDVGSKLHLIIDGVIIEHPLSQAEIEAGTASVPGSSAVGGNSNNIAVALVDQAGNVSSYQEYVKSTPIVFTETFDTEVARSLPTGTVVALTHFDLKMTRGGGSFSANQGDYWYVPSTTIALTLGGGSVAELDLTGRNYSSIAFRVGDLNGSDIMRVVFHDQNGNEVYNRTFNDPSLRPAPLEIKFDMPQGLTFSTATITGVNSGAFWVDDIKLGRTTYEATGEVEAATNQVITQDDVQYFGGDADNIFSLADVNLLSGADSGVNGGDGVDTLRLTGSGQILDLGILAGKLESIEIIDITGTGNNTLNLSLGDVLEQGESSLFTDDNAVQMMVKGNVGDVVNLDDLLLDGTDPGDWADQGTVTVEGITYNVFQHSSLDAQLLVQDGVTTNLV